MLLHTSQMPYSSFGPGWIGLRSLQFEQNTEIGRFEPHIYGVWYFVAVSAVSFDGQIGCVLKRVTDLSCQRRGIRSRIGHAKRGTCGREFVRTFGSRI
jgi:hypothetical protein